MEFTIGENPDPSRPGFSALTQRIEVLGLEVYGEGNVRPANMRHAAAILAELLDNDEDGEVEEGDEEEDAENEGPPSVAAAPTVSADAAAAAAKVRRVLKEHGQSLKSFFSTQDEDSEGSWDIDEMRDGFAHLADVHLSDAAAKELFEAFDEDGSGTIELKEMRAAFRKLTKEHEATEAVEAARIPMSCLGFLQAMFSKAAPDVKALTMTTEAFDEIKHLLPAGLSKKARSMVNGA